MLTSNRKKSNKLFFL